MGRWKYVKRVGKQRTNNSIANMYYFLLLMSLFSEIHSHCGDNRGLLLYNRMVSKLHERGLYYNCKL